MTFPGPAFQECTWSCHENVPHPEAVSFNLRSTDGLTVLARIEIVTNLVHYQPSYNTSHTQSNPVTHCRLPMSLCASGCSVKSKILFNSFLSFSEYLNFNTFEFLVRVCDDGTKKGSPF